VTSQQFPTAQPLRTYTEAEKRARAASVSANAWYPDLGATVAQLQSRSDIPAAPILEALQTVLAPSPMVVSRRAIFKALRGVLANHPPRTTT
jgi:hypothetical protein